MAQTKKKAMRALGGSKVTPRPRATASPNKPTRKAGGRASRPTVRTIQLASYGGWTTPVRATIIGAFGVHRIPDSERGYRVTHVGTGYRAGRHADFTSRENAIKYARGLMECPSFSWDFTDAEKISKRDWKRVGEYARRVKDALVA